MRFCRNKALLFGQKCIEKGAWYFAPFSWIWGSVSFLKNFLYDRNWMKVFRVPCPVISIGNIVAGGTGKTPLVLMLASCFLEKKIAILSRGYGEIPDEPMLLQNRLGKAKVYVGKDRVRLAKQAFEEGADLIFLDDGFQYRKLYRDLDLVLLSGSDPFGKGHFLPWGFLRDSPKRLQSADAIFISGNLQKPFPRKNKISPIPLQVAVDRVLDLQRQQVSSIKEKKASIFCGIAKPHLFKETVLSLGVQTVSEWILADHERIDENALKAFAATAKSQGAEMLLCTEKDAVKISNSLQCALPIYYLEISLRVAQGLVLWENLIEKIEEKLNNYKVYGSRN